MRVHSTLRPRRRVAAIRLISLAAALFVGVAAGHETLLALENIAAQSHCTPARSAPAPAHHQDHSCALCEFAGTPTVLSPDVALPAPICVPAKYEMASHLTPIIRDTSCFPHLRRAPPSSFPLV